MDEASSGELGFAVQPKEWDKDGNVNEVVVEFTPDLFLTYAFNLEAYHHIGLKKSELKAIDAISKQSEEWI